MKVLALAAVALPVASCKSERPQRLRASTDLESRPLITTPFVDDFERAGLGPDWRATAPQAYKLESGKLRVQTAYNHPLWLLRRLPRDVQIDFDITSHGAAGDLKCEFFGDGMSFAPDKGQYTSSGYVAIFGGWNNQISTLVRQFEHDPNRRERTDVKVVPGQQYHWTLTREGTRVAWKIDGQPFLDITDAQPLYGTGHWFFAFDNWEVDTTIDNLRITPLGATNLAVEDPATAGR